MTTKEFLLYLFTLGPVLGVLGYCLHEIFWPHAEAKVEGSLHVVFDHFGIVVLQFRSNNMHYTEGGYTHITSVTAYRIFWWLSILSDEEAEQLDYIASFPRDQSIRVTCKVGLCRSGYSWLLGTWSRVLFGYS